MLGTVYLKRYKVLRQLDEGGMSKVYLGMQSDPPREVAIKVLRAELAGQSRVREHFRREIYILSKFQHPNAVTFYDADADAKQPVLVMEYLRGLDLLRLLDRHKRLSPERAGRLLGQMCAVLHAAHEEGIVHRDLKPGNLFIIHPDTPHEKVKLMDFGLAKMASMLYISPEDVVNSNQSTAVGTPEYICPEQIKGGNVDRRGDLYSLGVVLYEMLAGHRPFEGTDVNRLLRAHSDEPPPPLPPGAAPPGIEQLVMDCLAKYPEDRPATAEEVARRYEEALGKKIYDKAQAAPTGSSVRSGVIIRKMPTEAERNAIVRRLTASMPESMALVKLKGFIHDLGGEIVESVPGLIRVRLAQAGEKASQKSGLLGLFGRTAPPPTGEVINMELVMEKPDPTQPSRLSITLKLTTPAGMFNVEGRNKCERIGRDLQAYLMGR